MHRITMDQLAWRRTGDEGVVLDLGRSTYLALNDTATFLWDLLVVGADEPRLVSALCEEFDVDTVTASRAVEAFLADLTARGYLSATSVAASVPVSAPAW